MADRRLRGIERAFATGEVERLTLERGEGAPTTGWPARERQGEVEERAIYGRDLHVTRGGSWCLAGLSARSTRRGRYVGDVRSHDVGSGPARSLTPAALPSRAVGWLDPAWRRAGRRLRGRG